MRHVVKLLCLAITACLLARAQTPQHTGKDIKTVRIDSHPTCGKTRGGYELTVRFDGSFDYLGKYNVQAKRHRFGSIDAGTVAALFDELAKKRCFMDPDREHEFSVALQRDDLVCFLMGNDVVEAENTILKTAGAEDWVKFRGRPKVCM